MLDDLKETIKETTKEANEQQRENKLNTLAIILRCNVNNNELEVRGHDPGRTVDAFEQLKKESKDKLTDGNVRKENEGE